MKKREVPAADKREKGLQPIYNKAQLKELGLIRPDVVFHLNAEDHQYINTQEKDIRQELISAEGIQDLTSESIKKFIREQGINGWKPIAEKLERIMQRDYMTKMYTRRSGLEKTADLIKQAEDKQGKLYSIFIDIDYFQAYNNVVGHDFGNWVLMAMSKKLLEISRKYSDKNLDKNNYNSAPTKGNSMAVRLGGEELALLIDPDAGNQVPAQITAFLEEIRSEVSDALNQVINNFNEMYVNNHQNDKNPPPQDFDVRDNFIETTLRERKATIDDQYTISFSEDEINNLTEAQRQKLNEQKDKIADINKIKEELKKILQLSPKQQEQCTQTEAKKIQSIVANIDNYSPAEIIRILYNREPKKADEAVTSTFKEITESLAVLREKYNIKIEIGTATFGVVAVDFSEPQNNNISKRDLRTAVDRVVNSEEPFIKKEKFIELFSKYFAIPGDISTLQISYQKFRNIIEEHIEEIDDKEKSSWQYLIDKLYHTRAGRLLSLADTEEEKQKKIAKNSVGFYNDRLKNTPRDETTNIQNVDHQEENLEREEYDPQLKQELQALIKNLEQEDFSLIPDGHYRRYQKYLPIIAKVMNNPDILENYQQQLEDKLQEIQSYLYHEPLTNSKNSHYFDVIEAKKITKEIKEKHENKRHYSVCSIDFDNLRAVNLVGGHILGDIVLIKTNNAIREAIKDNEFITSAAGLEEYNSQPELIRMTGGEEFIITFPDLNEEQAVAVVQAINSKVKDIIHTYLKETKIAASSLGQEELKNGSIDKTPRPLFTLIKEYIKNNKSEYSDEECEKFGTITAGVVDIANLGEDILSGGEVREITDRLGEMRKATVLAKNENNRNILTGRGSVIGLTRVVEKVAQI